MPPSDSAAVIVDAVRSPIGRKGGTLSHIRGDELSAQVLGPGIYVLMASHGRLQLPLVRR